MATIDPLIVSKPDIPGDRVVPHPSSAERFLISDLCAILETYLEPDQVRQVYRAYLLAASAHDGQIRVSGEPYIYHPIAVSRVLAEMHMDCETVIAALLHDVLEDTKATREQMVAQFGEDIAAVVDGVSKLTHLSFESKAEQQAVNFRKMMLAMSKDLRVILVKLADRLHNMRTLGVMPPEKRRRIARETLEIYAPIAQRLGMNAFRHELEQLGFHALYPNRYRVLANAVIRSKGQRKEVMHQIEVAITKRLEEKHIEARVLGREKNLWSIYRKMRGKRRGFRDVLDVFAIRVVVDTVDTCYLAMGALHTLYKPVPGKFKDYIAIPKANGYQSLHTILFGPHGVPIEIQLRTDQMDRVAETGIAAHWYYKSGDAQGNPAWRRAREWLKNLMELQQNTGNALEFLEHVKVDLFPDEVYVFTPKGEIMSLPRGATGIDFAYAVHTDIGNRCVAIKIDHELAPLSTPLANGQTVEVLTEPHGRPRSAWLDYAVTAKARHQIRAYLRNLQAHEATRQGRVLLEKALAEQGLDLSHVSEARLARTLGQLRQNSIDDLLKEIGLGNRLATLVARDLSDPDDTQDNPLGDKPLVISGAEGMVLNFAKCCCPIPGDPIIGTMTTGRGMVIHRSDCRNIRNTLAQADRAVAVRWADAIDSDFPANIRALTMDRRGVLGAIASAIAEMNANITSVSLSERDPVSTYINLTVSVHDRLHLSAIMRRLRGLPEVIKIARILS
ncbi:MAG: RelA/SpoT family protein [Thiotrichales bacterium]